MTTTKPQSTTEKTRVKERLNLFYHGLKEREKPTMFREVREWLREMDDAETDSLHSVICNVVHRHCKDVQLPSGTIGLENDLIEALSARLSPASTAPVVDVAHCCTEGVYRPYPAVLCSLCKYVTHNLSIKELCERLNTTASTPIPAPTCVKCGHVQNYRTVTRYYECYVGIPPCGCKCEFDAATTAPAAAIERVSFYDFASAFIAKQYGPCPSPHSDSEGEEKWHARLGLVAHAIGEYAAATAAPVEQSDESQYVVIDGERRRAIPCPDGKPDCEVLHTEPVTSEVEEGS